METVLKPKIVLETCLKMIGNWSKRNECIGNGSTIKACIGNCSQMNNVTPGSSRNLQIAQEISIHTYTYIYIYMYTYVFICIYIYTSIHVCM